MTACFKGYDRTLMLPFDTVVSRKELALLCGCPMPVTGTGLSSHNKPAHHHYDSHTA